MYFNLVFVTALAGSASAASMPKRSYGQSSGGNAGGYSGGSNGGYGSESSSVSPVMGYPETASPARSSGYGVYPVPPSVPHNSGYPPVPYPTGSYPSPSSHPIPSGPIPPHKGPTGSGSAHPPGPTGTGSLSPPGPTGTGSLLPPGQNAPGPYPSKAITTTIYGGEAGITTTRTEIGTTKVLETITDFIPCSTPIGTAKGSTYYSTYLTVEYHTSTHVVTATKVICPATPIPEGPTGGSSSSGYGSSGSGSSGFPRPPIS